MAKLLNFIQEHKQQVQNLPENVKAQAVEAGTAAREAVHGKAQESERPDAQSSRPSQADGKEALIRNQGAQGKTQEAMSPTDHGKSQTQAQARVQNRGMSYSR